MKVLFKQEKMLCKQEKIGMMKTLLRRTRYFTFALVLLLALTSAGVYASDSSGFEAAAASDNAFYRQLLQVVKGNEGATSLINAKLYETAVIDSMTIEEEEIMPLIPIAKDSPWCSWDEKGRVLMLTHHSYPDSYVAGEEYTLKYGEVWTFTDKEIINWYKENKNGVSDWPLRLKQLIGLKADREYTHFSAMWVKPEDIKRPGYEWELADTAGAAAFAQEPGEEYKAWFDSNIVWSYFDDAYPWTRLGYTYDWAADSDEYGLSEFLVKKDAVTTVEFTMTTDEFVAWLESQQGM